MTRLFVNVDHVATIRQARRTIEPSPLKAALLAEKAGAKGITVHLREDRRHVQDEDVREIYEKINTPMNLEMAPTLEMIEFALDLKPYQVSLVPEKRQEITTEGGLDVYSQEDKLNKIRERMQEKGILFSLFVDPDFSQVDACERIKADSIEINTGRYTELKFANEIDAELKKIRKSAKRAREKGLKVFAGHGLNYENVKPIVSILEIEELNIGHFLIGQAVYVGMETAVAEMIRTIALSKNGET